MRGAAWVWAEMNRPPGSKVRRGVVFFVLWMVVFTVAPSSGVGHWVRYAICVPVVMAGMVIESRLPVPETKTRPDDWRTPTLFDRWRERRARRADR
jgi:hypothetical protein